MQTLAGAGAALYQRWEVPGKPMTVYLSRAVTGAILLEGKRGLVPRRRPEVGGILLGTVSVKDTVTVRIEACVELPCEHLFGPAYALSEDEKQALGHAIIQYSPGGDSEMCTVGFYRTHTRRGLSMDSDDLRLAEFFPEGADLVLLVKPRLLRRSRGALFFWEGAMAEPDSPAIAFTIPREGSREYAAAPELLEEPQAAAAPEPPRKPRWRWPFWLKLLVLLPPVMVAAFPLGFLLGHQIDQVFPRTPPPPPRDPYTLSLMVLQYGDNLHLTWDRQARPIAAAERGSLTIWDAGQDHTLDLTAEQLRNGAVAYHEISQRVRFRLEVFLPDHHSVSEIWESAPPEK
jgi:hypothetical protein